MRRISVMLGISLLLALWPLTAAQAHALPVSYDPQQNALLSTPPTQIQIRFSEHLNPDLSRIVVVNPSNQRVDNGDSQVSGDAYSMTVSLPVLPAGTYVVAWRSHSADDGHVTGGSYIFHILRADGTVPPLSGPLPTGNIVGGAGGTTGTLDLPTLFQAIAHWVGLVALNLLLGVIFWWSIILPRQKRTVATAPGFRQLADIALETIIVATIVEVALQAVILDGTARGLTSWPLISGILLHSRQGIFYLTRIGLAILGLICIWTPALRTSLTPRNLRLVLPIFGVALAVAFVYSGHGGAAQVWWGSAVDLLHLLAAGIWLGGIGVLAWVIIPTLTRGAAAERWRYLAQGLPAFSVPALIAAASLALTGSLNADARLTSLSQLWTTTYGIVLMVKIGLFLIMAAISYVHAFRLRPQLAAQIGMAPQLAARARGQVTLASWWRGQLALLRAEPTGSDGAVTLDGATLVEATTGSAEAPEGTSRNIARLLRVEATLGLGVLLCAALLSPLAGTLAPPLLAGASFGATGGNQTLTQTADKLSVTLSITPGRFGPNTVTVTVKNPDGSLASHGTVFIVATMQEMDMGVNEFDLTPGTQSGTYTGSVALSMAGHWNLQTVIRTKEDPNNLHRTTFVVSAAF